MHLSVMLDMVGSAFESRPLLGAGDRVITGAALAEMAKRGAASLAGRAAVVYVGENHPLLPVALFSAAWAGIPFVPVNYRLEDAQLNALVARQGGALVLGDASSVDRIRGGALVLDEWLAALPDDGEVPEGALDDEDVAVVLYTSGTTAEPKSALLRHRHLTAYLISSVEFGGATDDEAVLISVPPYHVAGVANLLSNLYAGRRLVYLRSFDPDTWLDTVLDEHITNAMVVPTMLARIVDAVAARGDGPANVPTLRTLSYGGARVATRVLREALRRFPDVGFVNGYGLTETASTIALLGPDDHRAALDSDDPVAQARLASVGRVLPAVEVEVRDDDARVLPAGETGIVFLRGEQISGEYATGSRLDTDGWFCTRDRGRVDADGFLFIEGRADDTIIRGGENIAPAEIEEVLLEHPAVREVCVVGVPDDEWGQRIVAAVVLEDSVTLRPDELRALARSRLRGARTPDEIVVRGPLPHTDTGKLLRRRVLAELIDSDASRDR